MARRIVVVIWVLLLGLPAPLPAHASPRAEAPAVVSHAAAPAPVDCNSLWSTGFPVSGLGLTDCLEHSRDTIGGGEYRVLYPVEWDGTIGWGSAFLEPARQAIRDSVAIFGKLGDVFSINLVFSPRMQPIDPLHPLSVVPAGSAHLENATEPCGIVMYPKLVYHEAQFKQTIAHEVFHCFQKWNFAAQMIASGHWWMEGSATYFGNVVYPNANKEWLLIELFDAGSATASITASSYAACFFFQHLGNAIGNEAIIRLLATMPTGGGEAEQQAALRAWPGMDVLFQEFAQSYLDGMLLDTNGSVIPFTPKFGSPTALNKAGNINVQVQPFVVGRRLFTGNPKVSVTATVDESVGTTLYGIQRDIGSWSTGPFEFACDDAQHVLAAITSVGTSAGPSAPDTMRLTVTTGDRCEEPTPDPKTCLQGTWTVRDYEAFMVAALAMAGTDTSAMPITFEGASGGLDVTIGADTITYAASNFELRGSTVAQGITIQVTLRFTGTATVTYEVTKPGTIQLILVDPGTFTVEAETALDGSSMGTTALNPLDWILFATPTYTYTCTDSRLELSVPPSRVPVIFER